MKFIANRLKDRYKVYIFDRRCCGKSEKNCELTYEESAKDVYEFIKNYKRKKINVILDTDTYNECDDQFALAYLLKTISIRFEWWWNSCS